MKKILILIAVIISGCDYRNNGDINPETGGVIEVTVVDSCEYIIYRAHDHGNIIHKGDCRFCIKMKRL